MAKISMIGLDLAKNVFQIHGIDAAGTVVVRGTDAADHAVRAGEEPR